MKAILKAAVDAAMQDGATLASARLSVRAEERYVARDAEVRAETRDETGVFVRARVNGADGFASTSDTTQGAVLAAAREAVNAARATAILSPGLVELTRGRAGPARYAPSVVRAFASVPRAEKIAFARALVRAGHLSDAIASVGALLRFLSEDALIVTSEGGVHERSLSWVGAGVRVVASGGGRIEVRTAPAEGGGVWLGGFDVLERLELPLLAARAAHEAEALLAASPCPEGPRDVVLDPWLAARLLQETIVRGLVLGEPSFLDSVKDTKVRVGSSALTLVHDPSVEGCAGSIGVDDEGIAPRAQTLVHAGLVMAHLSDRLQATRRKLSPTGSARATSFREPPGVHPTNVSMGPGGGDLDALLAEVKDGVFFEGARAFTVDARGATFRISADVAWEVKDGKRTKVLRNGALGGRTADFWKTCDAIGGLESAIRVGFWSDERARRSPLPIGHRAVPVRLRSVIVLPVPS